MVAYIDLRITKFLNQKVSQYYLKARQLAEIQNRAFLGQKFTAADNPGLYEQNPAFDTSQPVVVSANGQAFQGIISGNPQPLDSAAGLSTAYAVQIEEAYRTRNDEDLSKSIFLILNKPSELTDDANFQVSVAYLCNATSSKICSLKAEIEDLISLAKPFVRNGENAASCTANFSNDRKDLALYLSINASDYDPFWNIVSNQVVGTVVAVFKNFKILPDLAGKYKFGYSSKQTFNTIGSSFPAMPASPPGTTLTKSRSLDFTGVVAGTPCSASSELFYTLIPGSSDSHTNAAPINGESDILTPQIQLNGEKLSLCFGYTATASTGASFLFDQYIVDTSCPASDPHALSGLRPYQKVITSSSSGLATGLIHYDSTSTLGEEVVLFEGPLVDASSYNSNESTGTLIFEDALNLPSPNIFTLARSSQTIENAGCTSETTTTAQGTTDETICYEGDPRYSYTDPIGGGLIVGVTDLRIFQGKSGKAVVLSVNYVTPVPTDGGSISTGMLDAAQSKTFVTSNDFHNIASTGNIIDESPTKDVNPVVTFTDKLTYTTSNSFPSQFLQSSVIKPVDSYKFVGLFIEDVDGSIAYGKLTPNQASGSLIAFTGKTNSAPYKFGPDIRSKITAQIYKIDPETGSISVEKATGKLPPQTATYAWQHYEDIDQVVYQVVDFAVAY